jgi:hypothetical protein
MVPRPRRKQIPDVLPDSLPDRVEPEVLPDSLGRGEPPDPTHQTPGRQASRTSTTRVARDGIQIRRDPV